MNNRMLFAEIILPLPVRQTYTYRVPENLQKEIQQGKRVIVQFGQRKMYTGLVHSLHHTIPEPDHIKTIQYILDDQPLINSFQFRFWEWMADYYMCTVGEIYKAALPSGLKLESESRILVNEYYEQGIDEEGSLVLKVIAENNGLSVGDLSRITGRKDVHRAVRKLMEDGAVYVEERLKDSYKPRMETFVSLQPAYKDSEAVHDLLDMLSRANRQKEVVNEILSLSMNDNGIIRPVDIPLSSLRPRFDVSAINSLVRKKILLKTRKISGRLTVYGRNIIPPNLLNDSQQEAYSTITESFRDKNVVLLHGVTSSGKTEIYIHLIREYLDAGKQVLYLLPEIALTSQIVERLRRVFGDMVGIYHSKFSDSERVEVYMRLRQKNEKQYRLILGVRSAIFLPFQDLGLIIIDEEHENTFKQHDPAPRYHARDAAVMLASLHGAKVLMGTATPSVETYSNCLSHKYGLAKLAGRFGDVLMPEILVADVSKARRKGEMKSVFTPMLLKAIDDTLAAGKQIILFQNRRGYSSFLQCNNCGWIPRCEKCDVSLTYHRYEERLICHYCGYSVRIPHQCDECHGTGMVTRGFGTELVEDEISLHIPGVRVARLDLDTSRSRKAYENILEGFAAGRYNILAGTQMLSKGLDFENVALVGILNADQMLNFPDFRAFERSFQLMSQVSGRAGRKKERGKVIIQTSDPTHPVIRYVIKNDFEGLYRDQIMERQAFAYPPFVRLIKLVIKGREKESADKAANELAIKLRKIFGRRVLGPQPPVIGRIKNLYLNQIILKVEKKSSFSRARKLLQEAVDECYQIDIFKKVRISIDVDPM